MSHPKNESTPLSELEKICFDALIASFKPHGAVLEIGFGSGYSAKHIQSFHPKTLTIIESDKELIKKAKEWAKGFSNVQIVEDSWQNGLKHLGKFDLIFLNNFEVKDTQSQPANLFKAKELLDKEEEIHSFVEENLPDLTTFKYSDADIEYFFSQVDLSKKADIAKFLKTLKQGGQISEQQRVKFAKKYDLETQPEKKQTASNPNFMLEVVSECAKDHMAEDGLFTCFINKGLSYYDQPPFFEQVITSPDLDYQEKPLPFVEKLSGFEAYASLLPHCMLIKKQH